MLSMKFKWYLTLLLFPLISGCGNNSSYSDQRFSLEQKYYNNDQIIEIQAKEEYESLIDNKESFVVYIYSPGCYACGLFKPVIEGFVEEENITIYQINAYYLSETSLVEHVQYTPSVALFNQGSFYRLLDPIKAEDAPAFESINEFTNWFYTYVMEDYQPRS